MGCGFTDPAPLDLSSHREFSCGSVDTPSQAWHVLGWSVVEEGVQVSHGKLGIASLAWHSRLWPAPGKSEGGSPGPVQPCKDQSWKMEMQLSRPGSPVHGQPCPVEASWRIQGVQLPLPNSPVHGQPWGSQPWKRGAQIPGSCFPGVWLALERSAMEGGYRFPSLAFQTLS